MPAASEAIYRLVATGKGFGEWWAADITEAAGVVSLGFFNRATVYLLSLQVDRSPAHAEWPCESGHE